MADKTVQTTVVRILKQDPLPGPDDRARQRRVEQVHLPRRGERGRRRQKLSRGLKIQQASARAAAEVADCSPVQEWMGSDAQGHCRPRNYMHMRRLLTILIACAAAQTGAAYLFRRQRKRYAGDRRHILVTQGGSQLRLAGDEISDAVVSVMMGGVVLDLRNTELAQRPARLDVLSIMGGVQLVVPRDWKIRIDVEPSMAGIHDGRTGSIDPERPPDIVVSGRVVMSGLDISSEMPGRRNTTIAELKEAR